MFTERQERKTQATSRVTIWIAVLTALTLPFSVGHADIRDGLAGHWGFYGDLLDSSGNGNHAQAHGDAGIVADADHGNVVEFDGNGDYLQVPNSPSLNITGSEITLLAWVYFDDVSGPPEIVIAKPFQDGQHTSPYFSYGLHMLSNGTPRFWLSLSVGARNAPGSPNFQSGRWYHMAGVYDGSQMVLYVDGEVSATTSVSGSIVGYDTPLFLGINGGRGEPMAGKIDDVAIFARALTQEEIEQAMEGLADPTLASNPSPENDAVDVPRDTILAWSPGAYAHSHDVYFGTAPADVNTANRTNPRGVLVSEGQTGMTVEPPSVLEFGRTYYWRIDEVNAAPDNTIFQGEVWNFTVEPFAYPIEGIMATSNGNSDATAGPENTVNGSGLNANDEHSIDATDMWLATPGADPLWIEYEFDRVYKLHEMLVWNYNVQFELVLGFGIKEVTVEYSSDGIEWTVLGNVAFAKATAMADYAANTVVDFGGAAVKYVRFNVTSGHGPMGQFGLSEVRFMYIPAHARQPEPADGAIDVDVNAGFRWRAGREAVTHDVYLGETEDTLALVDSVDVPNYTPSDLLFGASYSWKIVEVNEADAITTWDSNVWRFVTMAFATIDDFEGYDDEANRIFDVWLDGFVNGTGATVGYFEAPFAEQTIVNSGSQSMPLGYDNSAGPFYSEAAFDLGLMDLDTNGANTLRLFVSGQAPAFAEAADGSILMNAIGNDIWGTADQFRYAYRTLTGNGSLTARVDAIDGSPHGWVKGGVMIRQSTGVGAVNAFTAVTGGSGDGATFQWRAEMDASSSSSRTLTGIAPPYYVRIVRAGNTFTGYLSADGVNWEQQGDSSVDVAMADPVLIGLALTSHNANQATSAEFADVSFTGNVSASWETAEIGVAQPMGNDIAPLYVALEDNSGNVAVAPHPDENAVGKPGWNEWLIPYSELSGVNLSRVATVTIGVGDRDNPTAGGTGMIFIDDIGYGKPATVE